MVAAEALGTYDKDQQKAKPFWWDEEIERELIQKRYKYYRFLATKRDDNKVNLQSISYLRLRYEKNNQNKIES